MKSMREDIRCQGLVSPPSRGAWIEISYVSGHFRELVVAPLAGGVD